MEDAFILGDCMEYLPSFPDKHFDIAVVDPPYGINVTKFGMGDHFKGRGNSTARNIQKGRLNQGAGKLKDRVLNRSDTHWDYQPPTKEYFDELFRVSKNQVIWGGNYFDLPPTRCVIVWDKEQPWENFAQVEIAWTSFDRPATLYRQSNTYGNPRKIHPTQKPVALYKWILERFAPEGCTVLDTHAGSGSSLIACRETGRHYTAYEIDETYYHAARMRLEEASAQMNIYDFVKGGKAL